MNFFLLMICKNNFGRILTFNITLVIIFLLSGCSNVTQENYARIKVGMKYDQVVAILGEPTNCDSVMSATNCTWGSEKRSIEVSLVADKVVFLASNGL